MNNLQILKIFIGFDERETIAWHVLANSIMEKATIPVMFCPLRLNNLTSLDVQKEDAKASNAFSYTRFLVPYLCNFHGMAVFMDCDMLVTVDMRELIESVWTSSEAVHLVKHDYESKVTKKYLGNQQENYPRKNWSSFVVWNCEHSKNRCLTPEYIKSSSPSHLHRFMWLEDTEIGGLEKEWNWLVTEYEKVNGMEIPKNIHWTLGGPYFDDYSDTDYAELWRAQFAKTVRVDQNET